MKKLFIPLLFAFGVSHAQIDFDFDKAERLKGPVNSKYEETAPFYDPNQDALYFTRTLHPDNIGGKNGGQDIWVSYREGNQWGSPHNDFIKLNNQLNNSVIGVSGDGETLYLLSTYQKKLALQPGFSYSSYNGESWAKPVKLGSTGLTIQGNFYSGFVNAAGNILIISMEGKEAIGNEDLYISILENGEWTEPVWMGDSINSEGFEISPYLYEDNRTIMFGSNGHGGFGDCDLFYAYRKDSSWTNWTVPRNMGKNINTEKFDAFAFPVEDKVYFSSNRVDTMSNIYVAVNTQFYKEAAPLEFVFRMNESNISKAVLEVYDDQDALVGTYYGDAGDRVVVSGLKQAKTYKIVPRHNQVDLSLFTPFLVKDDGTPVKQLSQNEDGAYEVVPESADALAEKPSISWPKSEKGMSGVFELDGVPVRNVIMALNDADGKPVQYAITDSQGEFGFATTDDEENLDMATITELEYLKDNGVVYFTDPKGNKLFRAASNEEESGAFKYQKLEAQEIAQLKLLAELKEDKPLKETEGVFKYQSLAQEGVELNLLDENDNIVETVVTDADGKFKFSKLRPDLGFKIKVSDEADATLRDEGLVFFMDTDGNELNILNNDRSGSGFSYQPLGADLIQGLRLFEEEDQSSLKVKYVFSVGVFKYQNLPKEGTMLELLDENDNVIETVSTDKDGHFIFSKLSPDLKYKVRVAEMNDSELSKSSIYFVNKNGQVTTANLDDQRSYYTFSKLSPDYFFSVQQLNENENDVLITESFKNVQGTFKYQSLGKEGVELYLLDENDRVIETVLTDENGNFKFRKLAKEASFSVRMSEEDMSLLNGADILLTNENDEPLEQGGMTDDGFKFVTLPSTTETVLSMNEGDDSSLSAKLHLAQERDAEMSSTSNDMDGNGVYLNSIMNGLGKNDLTLNITSFHFNSVRLSDRDRARLNRTVLIPSLRSNQPILIVGYSCDIGDKEEQEAVARMRAEEVKEYLISAGLPESKIETAAVTGMLDDIDNPTTDQRVENRKVEVMHLVP